MVLYYSEIFLHVIVLTLIHPLSFRYDGLPLHVLKHSDEIYITASYCFYLLLSQ